MASSSEANITVIGSESPYDLILDMTWLVERQPWSGWRTRAVVSDTQGIRRI